MNTIKLSVSDLKSTVLPSLGRLVSRRSTLPVLQSIRITRDVKGGVSLQATDLDSHVTYHCPEPQPGEPIDLLIPFEPLNRLMKGLGKQEMIEIGMADKNRVNVHYQLSGSEMNKSLDSIPASEFPSQPIIKQPGFAVGPEFGLAVKQAFQCCSQDPTRLVLNGVCLDVDNPKQQYVVGTNGRILYSANSFTFPFKKSVSLPSSKFLTHTDLIDEGCMLTVEPPAPKAEYGFIKLESPRWSFITKEGVGPFPNWKQCVPEMTSPKAIIKLGPAAIKQILEVLPHLPGNVEPDHKVRFSVNAGELRLEGPDHEKAAWTGVWVSDANVTGKPITIALNRNYLAAALKFNLNEVRLEDELSPMVFVNGGKRMVVMPGRLSAETSRLPAPVPVTQPQPSATPPATTTPPQVNPEANEKEPEMAKTEPKPTTQTPTPTPTPAPSLLQQIDQLKETLKSVIRDLTGLGDAVKLAEKQQRLTEKEVESARQTLEKLKQVTI